MASSARLRFSSSSAELPVDLLLLILEKVRSLQDFVAFASVCKSWREAATNNKHRLCPQIPWMILPDLENHRLLCGLPREESEEEEYTLTKNLHIPVKFKFRKQGCFGLNYGWILTVSREGDMSLVHPLFGTQIELPRMNPNNVLQGALSSDPSQTSDFAVTILRGNFSGSESYSYTSRGDKRWSQVFRGNLSGSESYSYTSRGDKRWSQVFRDQQPVNYEGPRYVSCFGDMWSDLTYYKDRLYVVDRNGRVWSLGFRDRGILDDPEDRILVADLRILPLSTHKIYIVGSEGNLLVVVRRYQSVQRHWEILLKHYRVCKVGRKWMGRFEVHKVDLINGEHQRITSLGNKAIFVGYNTTTTIFEVSGGLIKPNHIYYTRDDNYTRDVSLYCHRLEDGVSRVLKVPMSLGTEKTPPFWYMPAL